MEKVRKVNGGKMSKDGIVHLLNTTEGHIEIRGEGFTIVRFRDGATFATNSKGEITQKLKDGTLQVIQTLENR